MYDQRVRTVEFFCDLHAIEEHICGLWMEYRDSTIATILTNAALCLVERKEKEITEDLGIAEEDSYERLTEILPQGHGHMLWHIPLQTVQSPPSYFAAPIG